MRRLLLTFFLALLPVIATAQLVQPSDLAHEYSFTIPDISDGGSCTYVNGAIAYNPANDSLFLVCHDWTQTVAEITIPAASGQAAVIQTAHEAANLSLVDPGDPNGHKIGGLFVAGDRLLLSAYAYYDADHTANSSHFARSTDLAAGSADGPARVGTLNPGFYAGYFSAIPSAWQSALGGDLLIGQCCIPITGRTSFGLAAFAASESDLVVPNDPTSAQPLLYYTESHQTMGEWGSTSDLYNGSTQVHGAVFVGDSVLFFGMQGTGDFCYGGGDACGDTWNPYQGTHAYPYRSQFWAYDANDLAAVVAGTVKPWDILPYAYGQLPGIDGPEVNGVAYDSATGRVFLTERYGDGDKPRIHVFTITGVTGSSSPPPEPNPEPEPDPEPDPDPDPTPSGLTADEVQAMLDALEDTILMALTPVSVETVPCEVRSVRSPYSNGDYRLLIRCPTGGLVEPTVGDTLPVALE